MTGTFGKIIGAVTLAATIGIVATPLGAQQRSPGTNAASQQGGGSEVSDATVQRTGAALRDISGIQTRLNQRMQEADPAQHQAIEQEANTAAETALASHGLTVSQYNGVLRMAQADPALRERLVEAARGKR